jgi:hypothetical protein
MVEKDGEFRMLTAGELVIGILMHHAHTKGEKLYSTKPLTYSRTAQKVEGRYPVVVGGFGSVGLIVLSRNFDHDDCGAAAALR